MVPLKSIYGDRLVNGRVMVEWVELGEGWHGDYDPEDADDEELLRFDVSYKFKGSRTYGEPRDCSYCTAFPAKSTLEERQKGLEYLMHYLKDVDFENGYGKRMCERLSWIDLDWLEKQIPCPKCGCETWIDASNTKYRICNGCNHSFQTEN